MRLNTCYFAKTSIVLAADMVPIVISTSVPFWTDEFILYDKLYPPNDILWDYKNGKISEQEYIKKYRNDILAKLDPHEVYLELEELSGGKNICFMCWEKPNQFCHRHIVADWFRKAGYSVYEFTR